MFSLCHTRSGDNLLAPIINPNKNSIWTLREKDEFRIRFPMNAPLVARGVLAKWRMVRKTTHFSAKQQTILYFSLSCQFRMEIGTGRENNSDYELAFFSQAFTNNHIFSLSCQFRMEIGTGERKLICILFASFYKQ